MAENDVAEVPVDSGTSTATIEGGGAADAATQQEMTGDFFTYDPGFGSYVKNDDGMPPTDKAGNPITMKSQEDLDRFLASQKQTQRTPQQTQNAKTGQSNKPESIAAIYEKDGKLDFSAIDESTQRFNKFGYKGRDLLEKSNTTTPTQPQQPPQKLSQREMIKGEIEKLKKTYEEDRLKPVQQLWAKMFAEGAKEGDPAHIALSELHNSLAEKMQDMLEEKREELREKYDKEREESERFASVTKEAERNFLDCANEYFPNSDPARRRENLEKLIFGAFDASGKMLHKGYGADTVNMLFDYANEGKVFKSQAELGEAYKTWWSKFTSNPQNVRHLAQIAYGQYQLQNHQKIRDGYRTQWDLEQQKKLNQSQAPASSKAGNAEEPDAAQSEIDRFFAVPK